jgi:hypothetical protein
MNVRKCSDCKNEYPSTTEFFYKKSGKGRAENALYSYCKTCFKKIQGRKHSVYKNKLLEYASNKCLICGYNKHNYNLTFHHIDPSKKEFGISKYHGSLEKAKKEVDKCIVVCHNCHGDIHHGLYPQYIVLA